MVGVFFLTCSPILDLGHFSQVILPIVLQIMPQPKNNQPSGAVKSIWWLGLIFFLTCSPILDLGHFSQVILPIVLLIMPQLSGAGQSIWWLGLFFFDLFSHSGLRHFSQVILPIVLQIMPQPKNNPNHQVLWTAPDGWV